MVTENISEAWFGQVAGSMSLGMGMSGFESTLVLTVWQGEHYLSPSASVSSLKKMQIVIAPTHQITVKFKSPNILKVLGTIPGKL